MASTLFEQETAVTTTSRELGHVPERWVEAVETDGSIRDALDRIIVPHHHVVLEDEFPYPFAEGVPRTDTTGSTIVFCSLAAPRLSAGTAGFGGSSFLYAGNAPLRHAAAWRWAIERPWGHAASVQAPHHLAPIEVAQAAPEASFNAAVQAVEDLRQWLGVPLDAVAALTGVSRSAVLYWKRKDAQPRPSAARNLFRVHALVRAVRDAVAPERPIVALMRRAEDGPSAYDLLAAGRYDDAERLLRPQIFPPGREVASERSFLRWPDKDEPAPLAPGETLTLKRPLRRARRVSLRA